MKFRFIFLLILCSCYLSFADSTYVKEEVFELSEREKRVVINKAFKVNELLHFEVNYGGVTAGYATIEVDRYQEYKGRKCYILKTTAQSRKSFNWIFKVKDWTESYLDAERFHSLRFEKHLKEGSYHRDVIVAYDQKKNKAYYSSFKPKSGKLRKKTIDIPDNVVDALSALFYVRTMDFEVGDEILLPGSDNKKIYPIKVIVHKKEKIKVPAGKFKCIVVEPVMADGGVFKKNGKVKVWLTDDDRKMPVKMETKVFIGSIKAELDWYEEGDQ